MDLKIAGKVIQNDARDQHGELFKMSKNLMPNIVFPFKLYKKGTKFDTFAESKFEVHF